MRLSVPAVDWILWVPLGAAVAIFVMRRRITRRIAARLDEAISAKPGKSEWARAKNEVGNYRAMLYVIFGAIGALIGACIGGIGYFLRQ